MKESSPDQASKSPTEQSNQVGSLEPDLSSFSLRRRKTDRSGGNLDNESPPISPSFGPTRSRPTEKSGVSNKSNLDASRHTSSGASSFSIDSRYPLNVSDWNEKVVRETKPEQQLRQMSDPPRLPRDGFEWVWFPEGYWAERETVEYSSRKSKGPQKWFNRAPEQRGSSSNASKTSPQNVIPQIKSGSNKSRSRSRSQDSSSRGSQKFEEHDANSESRSIGGSKLLQGLQQLSPTYLHFTSPTGEREGLYCRTKRGIESRLVVKKQKMYPDNVPAISSTITLPCQTTILLEEATSYLDREQKEHNQLGVVASSPGPRPRRFGLAPWHRRSSQESFLSASSSVHRTLMGKAPSTTPRTEAQFSGQNKRKYTKVEISDPGQPNFLPSEATRINTPPLPEETTPSPPQAQVRGFFDLNSHDDEPRTISSAKTSAGSRSGIRDRIRERLGSLERWEYGVTHTAVAKTTAKQLVETRPPDFELNYPEHLPNSPLCPMNPMNKSGGLGICAYHGRQRKEV